MEDVIFIRYNRLPLTVSENEGDTAGPFVVANTSLHASHDKALAHIAAKFIFRDTEAFGDDVAVYNWVVASTVVFLDHSETGTPSLKRYNNKSTFPLEEQREIFVLPKRS